MAQDLEEMQERFRIFIKERDWEKFHNPKDIALSLSVEAGELLELFQWKSADDIDDLIKDKKEEMESEIADIFSFVLAFCDSADIDLHDAFMKKMEKNDMRYPKELVKGKSHKYTFYQEKLPDKKDKEE